jgi:predicted metalloendopeptidase
MAVNTGDLSGVRSSLEDLADTYENDDFQNVITQLENQLSGDSLAEYESADFTDNPTEALEEAAEDAGLSDKYARIFRNATSLRRALAEVASEAFDSSAREMLEDQASASNLDRAYTFCARGDFDEAAEAVGIDDQDFEHAADCKHQTAIEGGYARALFSGYRMEGSDDTYVEPSTPTDPNA